MCRLLDIAKCTKLLVNRTPYCGRRNFSSKFKEFVDGFKCAPKTPITSCNTAAGGMPALQLNSGHKMPLVGLGTWGIPPNKIGTALLVAAEAGYRHFDCAHIYENEKEVGDAIANIFAYNIAKRKELFITSKLWNTFHSPGLVKDACNVSLKHLRLNYLDLYLIHWPMGYRENRELIPEDACGRILCSRVDYVDTWKAMETLVKDGLVRSIGVANFNKNQLQRILKIAKVKPAVNQIECHPYLNQMKLIEFCKSKEIAVTAYSPLGSPGRPGAKGREPRLLDDATLNSIADERHRFPAQILLRFQFQRGIAAIPKSATPERIACNFKILDFELNASEMRALNQLNKNHRYISLRKISNHPHYPFNDPY